jgi:hypothetical protein
MLKKIKFQIRDRSVFELFKINAIHHTHHDFVTAEIYIVSLECERIGAVQSKFEACNWRPALLAWGPVVQSTHLFHSIFPIDVHLGRDRYLQHKKKYNFQISQLCSAPAPQYI